MYKELNHKRIYVTVKYKLLYKNLEVGSVEQLNADFPNLFGKYELNDSFLTNEILVKNYIQYSIQAYILMNQDEEKWIEFIGLEESKYEELIDSEDWKLIDEKNEVHKIMIPNFCDQNQIIWRWY